MHPTATQQVMFPQREIRLPMVPACRKGCQNSGNSDALLMPTVSQACHSNWRTLAWLELCNPQGSLTFLNQLLFTTVKLLQPSTEAHSVVAERMPQNALTRSNTCWKTMQLQQLLEWHAVIFQTSNFLAKEQGKSNRKQPGKLSSVSLCLIKLQAQHGQKYHPTTTWQPFHV